MALRVFSNGRSLEMVVDLGTRTRCNQEIPDVPDALKRAREDDHSALSLRKNEKRVLTGGLSKGIFP